MSNLTHQGTREICRNTQNLFYLTEILWDHQFLWMSEDVGENSGVGLHQFRCISIYAIYAIYEHCQKISCLFVQALGTGTKANL